MKMKRKIVLLFFLVVIFSSGCYSAKESVIMFDTPYGPIEKDSAMIDIMGTLGNPHYINSNNNKEVWHYYLEEGKHLMATFVNNKLISIEQETVQ